MYKPTSLAALLLAAALPYSTGRSWETIVDSAIYLASAVDYGRVEKSLERDPFDFTEAHHATHAPTNTPSIPTVEAAEEFPTRVSLEPSESPTMSPTARYQNIVGNGGCPVGKSLFEIRLFDSWGDGWDDTFMRITGTAISSSDATVNLTSTAIGASNTTMRSSIQVKQKQATVEVFKGRLISGSEGYRYACLQTQVCYTVSVHGGLWQSEIKWEIRQTELGVPREERDNRMAIAKGLAPEICQFSIEDYYGGQACPNTCGVKQTVQPTQVDTASPSQSPSTMFRPVSSILPSLAPSFVSATAAPTTPDDREDVEDYESEPVTEGPWNRTSMVNNIENMSDTPSLSPTMGI